MTSSVYSRMARSAKQTLF